jgi:hypothetical protein
MLIQILLEPIFDVEITSTEEYIGEIIADLGSRHGRVETDFPTRYFFRKSRRWFHFQKCLDT